MPTEHMFKAGHQIGIIVTGHLIGQTSAIEGGPAATNGSVITVDTQAQQGPAADRRRPGWAGVYRAGESVRRPRWRPRQRSSAIRAAATAAPPVSTGR